MNKFISGLVFAFIFFSFYTFMNYYTFIKIPKLFNFRFLWLVIIFLGFSFPIAMFLERIFHNAFTHVVYYMAGVWLGFIFILTSVYIIIDGISFFTNFPRVINVYAIILILLLSVYGLINAQIVQTTRVNIEVPNLEKEIKIVQLSDIHIGAVHKKSFLTRIVDKTNLENPDFVAITGDLFDGSDGIPIDEVMPLSKLNSKTFFVTGNHENYLGKDDAINAIKSQNIIVLENEVEFYKGVQIVGIPYSTDNEVDKSTRHLSGLNLNNQSPVIVLYHQPILQAGADLQLSGHTHNGQLIFFKPFVRMMFKQISGYYKLGNSKLYISQGLGTWGPPMRVFTKSEIVVITLKKD